MLVTVVTMGVLSLTREINIHWSRQRKQTMKAFNNFGLAGFTGMLLGLSWGVGAANDYLEALEASRRVSEATR